MKVIKPLKLGVLTRCFEFKGQFHMGVSILAFIPLGEKPALFSETSLWKFSSEQLGAEGILEAGIPKAHPEFLVTGDAFILGDEAKAGVAVKVGLGDLKKELYVFGDRYWQKEEEMATQAKPFTQMSLGWEQAFGGKKYAANPLGKGYIPGLGDNGTVHWLANIENPQQRVLSIESMPEPAGFGPIDFMWPQRTALQGTYDQIWQEKYYPGFPPDINWGIFNIACKDQQFAQALQGNEYYFLDNMHPELPKIEGHLPGLEARCFVTQNTSEGEQFKEIGTHLRTVWFFPGSNRAILIYQGSINIQEEDGADILHLLLGAEYIGQSRGIEHYQAILSQRLDKKKGALYALRDSDLLPIDLNTPDPDIELENTLLEPKGFREKNLRKKTEIEHEHIRDRLREQNMDVEKYGPKPFPNKEAVPTLDELPAFFEKKEIKAEKQRQKLEALKPAQEKKLKALCKEQNLDYAEIQTSRQKAGWAPPKLTAVGTVNKLQQIAEDLKSQGCSQEQIDQSLGNPDRYQDWIQKERETIELYRLSAHHQDKPPLLSLAESQPMRTRLSQQLKNRESVTEQDFLGVDLSNINLQGLDFSGIYLAGANLDNTDLRGANLTGAVLAHASLENTILDGAVLNKANLGKTNLRTAKIRSCQETQGLILSGADLSNADLSYSNLQGVECLETQFSQAILDHVNAIQMTFLESKLQGTSFQNAQLDECNFIQADITRGNFSKASLRSATFLSCQGTEANFQQAQMNNVRFVEKCDFTSANFYQAQLNEANLRGSNLTNSNLQAVEMNDADLSECNLHGAQLNQALARSTLFVKSDLSHTLMQGIDLMTAVLQWSNISSADLTNANLYQADLARVLVDRDTRFEGANMGKARLHPKRFR